MSCTESQEFLLVFCCGIYEIHAPNLRCTLKSCMFLLNGFINLETESSEN